MGWTDAALDHGPFWMPNLSTTTIPTCTTCGGGYVSLGGTQKGNQIVRIADPTASALNMATVGHAYNDQNNQIDYLYRAERDLLGNRLPAP